MSSLIDPLIAFVSAHTWLAYLAIFLAALLEAVPVLGSIVPGSTIILALSGLIPGGNLQLAPVLAAAIIGAVIGDGTAFWIGHRSKREILSAWPMARYPGVIAQSDAALGLRIAAMVSVVVRSESRDSMLASARTLRGLPEVQDVFVLGGTPDILVHVVTDSIESLRDFVAENLGANADFSSTQTNIVFEHLSPAKKG